MKSPVREDNKSLKSWKIIHSIPMEELLTMRENGEEEITEYLIEKYKPMVRQRVRVLYLWGGDQDDLIQEGMIGFLRRCGIIGKTGMHPFTLPIFVWTGRLLGQSSL